MQDKQNAEAATAAVAFMTAIDRELSEVQAGISNDQGRRGAAIQGNRFGAG